MALKITNSADPIKVEHIILTAYGAPGLGKTSLAYTADKPLLLDFDGGAYRSGNRGDTVQVKAWADVSSITKEDLAGYKTLVLDTAGRALDALAVDIIQKEPKLGRGGGSLTLQGFGVLKDRFKSFTTLIRSFGLDLVFLAHSDEQKSGDDIIERLDAQGGSKGEIYKNSDLMGRLKIESGRRILNFSPTDVAFGKNPVGFAPLVVPDFSHDPQFLAKIIAQAKDSLNKQSEEQKKVGEELTQWAERFTKLPVTVEDFNTQLRIIKDDASASVKEVAGKMLIKLGKEKGLVWSNKDKVFSQPAKEKEAA